MENIIERPSDSFDDRKGAPIDILLMHYTGMPDAAGALDRLCDPGEPVSAHYLVDEDGSIYRMVHESSRAWHAGVSFWAGETDINARSIGIEIVNPGHEWGYRDFPKSQMESVIALSKKILARYAIPKHRVIAHSDVAPERKQDPGERFDWRLLAENGVGLWVDPNMFVPGTALTPEEILQLRRSFAQFGYQVETEGALDDALECVVQAFRRHFDPVQLHQQTDSRTLSLIQELLTSKQRLEDTSPKV